MKQQFVVTHTIRQTEIPALQNHLGYKHVFSHNIVPTKKRLLLLVFS
jgi:hypothetical protein